MLYTTPMPHMPLSELRGFEKVAVPTIEAIAARPAISRAIHRTLGQINGSLILAAMDPVLLPLGLPNLLSTAAPKGLILVANHRSFLDMYVIASYVTRRTPLMKSLLFPVRENFFYTSPVGLAVNLIASGGTMWPPVFRDARKRVLNPIAFRQIAHVLGAGVVVGIHPEGTRGKGPDPHVFLPLKPGLGSLVAAVDPEVKVMPVFIAGMSSSVANEFSRGWVRRGARVELVRVHFGAALRAGDVCAAHSDPLAVTEAVFDHVRALSRDDVALVAAGGHIAASPA